MKPSVLIDVHKSKVKHILLGMEVSNSLSTIFSFIYIIQISALTMFLETILASGHKLMEEGQAQPPMKDKSQAKSV